jgi:hypothetical protein
MYLSEARRFAYLLKRIDVNVLNDNLEIIQIMFIRLPHTNAESH